ncbi:acyltransferase [Candidatus Dependentiae bacterium]|nr:acyltransferase [Candidatus Dependentiae bacterium]
MKERYVHIDFLRGIAIILVLFHHMPYKTPAVQGITDYIINMFKIGGWSGVDLFFVLSGFIVSNILFKEYIKKGKINLKLFVLRRIIRIFPPFYICLAVMGLVYYFFIGTDRNLFFKTIIVNLIYCQNYYYRNIFVHTWSLAVEEHFYIILPVILYIFMKINKNSFRKFWILLVVIIFSVILARYINSLVSSWFHYVKVSYMYATHLRFDGLAFGVLLSYFFSFSNNQFKKIFNKKIMLLSGFILISPFFFLSIENSTFLKIIGFSMLYSGYGIILSYMLCLKTEKICLFEKIIALIGKYSYSIYLYHFMVIAFCRYSNPDVSLQNKVNIIIYFFSLSVISVIAGFFIENPTIKLKNIFQDR